MEEADPEWEEVDVEAIKNGEDKLPLNKIEPITSKKPSNEDSYFS